MEENITQMRERHRKEIEALQTACVHEIVSEWLRASLTHDEGEVRICLECEKIIEQRRTW